MVTSSVGFSLLKQPLHDWKPQFEEVLKYFLLKSSFGPMKYDALSPPVCVCVWVCGFLCGILSRLYSGRKFTMEDVWSSSSYRAGKVVKYVYAIKRTHTHTHARQCVCV